MERKDCDEWRRRHEMQHDRCFKDNDINMRFFNVMHKFRNHYHVEKLIDMKRSEFLMLINIDHSIHMNGKTTVSQISSGMRMTNAAISRTIGDLEDQGYVVKTVNREDKRQVYIELTETGKERLKKVMQEVTDFSATIFDRFGKDNTEQLLTLLEKMYEVASDEYVLRIEEKKKREQ